LTIKKILLGLEDVIFKKILWLFKYLVLVFINLKYLLIFNIDG